MVPLSVVGIQKISQHCVDVLTLERLEDELCSSSHQAPDQLQPCFQPDCPPRCLSVFHIHVLPQRNHWPLKHIRTIHKLPKNQIPFFYYSQSGNYSGPVQLHPLDLLTRMRHIYVSKEMFNQGPDYLWSLKIPWHFS